MRHQNYVDYLRGTTARAALIIVATLSAGHAAAQATGTQATKTKSPQIEEVVVTAEKRSENVQRVPIAITAFTASELRRKSITEVSDLGRLTSNTNLDTASPFGGSNEVLSASIRGIGQDDFGINLDPGVGVYVDGVYLARTVGANVGLLDISRVEILKGPQGTLFGRNTIGGAINIVTATPGNVYKANIEATGGSFNRRDFQGTVDLPFIPDKLLGSLTFASLNRDGYQKRVPYPGESGYITDPPNAFKNNGTETFDTQGGEASDTLRGKLRFIATDSISDTLSADWTHSNTSSTPESLLAAPSAAQGGTFGNLYNLCVIGVAIGDICGPRGPGLSKNGTTNGNAGLLGSNRPLFGSQYITHNPDISYGTGPDYDIMTNYGVANTIDWNYAPWADLKSITSYRAMDWNVAVDPDASPITMNQGSWDIHQHQTSQEFQLTGSVLDNKMKYVLGLYYFNEGGSEQDQLQLGQGLLQIDGLSTINTSSYAGYSHVDYNVYDKLTFVLGARYSYDHKNITFNQSDLNLFDYKVTGCYPFSQAQISCVAQRGHFVFPTANGLLYAPQGPYTQDFYQFTPTAGFNYQFTRDIMGYFSYSKGFKDGGWTTRITQPEPELPSFGPEKSQTYEVGLKSEWLDHRLQLDMDGFYTNYNGIQLNFQKGISPTIENAGNAIIEGGELSGRAIVTDAFSLSATAGYMNAYYTSLASGINAGQSCVQPYEPCITLGSKLPKTPKWKFSISPQYLLTLANDAAIRFGLDYTHTAAMYNDAVNTSILRRPDTDIVDMNITYMSPGDRYELTLGGTNITDDRYLVTGNEDTTASIIYGTYDAPAEWYITARAKF